MRVSASHRQLMGRGLMEATCLRHRDLEGSGAGRSWKVALIATERQPGCINALASLDCTVQFGSVMDLTATLMADDLRERAGSSINRGPLCIPIHTWPESWLIRLLVLVNSGPALFCSCPGLLVQVDYTLHYPVNMVRERQRLLSRRGTSIGGTSWRPTDEETRPPCHCPHCHCFCHCPGSATANPV